VELFTIWCGECAEYQCVQESTWQTLVIDRVSLRLQGQVWKLIPSSVVCNDLNTRTLWSSSSTTSSGLCLCHTGGVHNSWVSFVGFFSSGWDGVACVCSQKELSASGSVLQRTNAEQCISAGRLHFRQPSRSVNEKVMYFSLQYDND